MYGTKTVAGASATATLAHTGMQTGWFVLTAVVLIVCGVTLLRLTRSKPSQIK